MKIRIGENIRALRTKKGITQEQLSEVLGVTCAAVSKWERGETYPDITLIFPIAYYFGVTVDELMGYDKDKVVQDIKRILKEYNELQSSGEREAAKKLISEAYREYPDDYNIMSQYQWSFGIDWAEPDLDIARDNAEELNRISDRIIGGCTDGLLRMWAWKMKAIVLHAQGQTDEALRIHREKLGSWWNSFEQANEQLFKKDRPEFLYWAKRNMYELADFAADKISKSIFFDPAIPEEKRIADIEACGDALVESYEKTGNSVFILMAKTLYGRLANDIRSRGVGTPGDAERIGEKFAAAWQTVNANCDGDAVLCDAVYQKD